MRRLIILIGLIAAAAGGTVTAQRAQRPPQRDARVNTVNSPTEISGIIVTDEDTPQPVRRAEVRAIVAGGEPRTTFTDASGRFVFANLPTGRYTIQASKAGFVRTAYGAKRHDRPGTPVTLSDTDRSQVLQMRMARGSVITGRIVDEFGQPAQGARVRAQVVRMINGERTVSQVSVPGAIFGEATDDRGVYRLYGLPAGEYVISATPRNSGWGDIRRLSEAEISAAERAVEQPRSLLEPEAQPVTLGYTAMFFPGVLSATEAGVISVKRGEERQGIDFPIQFVRTSTIEGNVILPATVRPEAVQLLMLPRRIGSAGSAGIVNFSSTNRRVGPDGRFSYTGITPGAYTISARVNGDDTPPLWANADVDVNGQNVSGVTLALQEGLNISGQMAFEMDGVDPPTLFSRARLNLVPADGGAMINLGRNTTQVADSGRFDITGVIPGRYRVVASFNTPEVNWILKSAVIKGRDAVDVPFELAAGDAITDAVLTFTNRTQELTGTLQDASKRPAPDYTVVVFPADRALWGATRRVRTTRPGTDGRFSIDTLPAGAYRIAAVVDIGAEELEDQALLEELAAASIPFTLAEGETKVQDLRLASGGKS